jgi:DNA-binding NarL/FixJ family response regulator
MKKRPRIILYGDTLVLEGVRTSLEASPAFEVIALEAAHAAEQDLLRLHPDVIIFDTGSVQPQFHYNLILQRSQLQLIGIDPDRDQVLLWSGQNLHELSIQDLVEVISEQ